MGTRLAQGIFMTGVIIGLAYLVISSADGWADWVVFGVIVMTTFGFAVAVAPRIYARRERRIARDSEQEHKPFGKPITSKPAGAPGGEEVNQ